MSISVRKGIDIDNETRRLYEQRDKSRDADPETQPLPPEKWAHAMQRSFVPSKNRRPCG